MDNGMPTPEEVERANKELRELAGGKRSNGNGTHPPKTKLPHIDKLIERICVVDRTRGIIVR
jgi:hypothetical protein